MRIEMPQRVEIFRAGIKETSCHLKRAARVLHTSGDEVEAIDLIVFVPGEGHADLAVVELDDLLGVSKRERRLIFVRGRHQQCQGQGAGLVLKFVEVTSRQRDEVVHMRLVLFPMPGREIAGTLLGNQRAVGNYLHAGRRVADDLAGEALVRVIVAWKPKAMQVRLALGPDLGVAGLVTHLGSLEIESVFRLGAGVNRRRDLGPGRDGGVKNQSELFVGDDLIGEPGSADFNFSDAQVHCVQF